MRGDRQVPLFFGVLFWLVIAVLAFRTWYPHQRWEFKTAGIHSFTLKTPDGAPVPLSQFKGKALLVSLFDSPDSMRQILPRLNRARDRYHSRGFEVIAVPVARFHDSLGDDRWIQEESARLGARFLVTQKISAKDGSVHPFYWFLSREFRGILGGGWHGWPCDKVLFAPDGTAVGQYGRNVPPDSNTLMVETEEVLPENWVVENKRMKVIQRRKMRHASVPLVPDTSS